jgi:hypothetical protein
MLSAIGTFFKWIGGAVFWIGWFVVFGVGTVMGYVLDVAWNIYDYFRPATPVPVVPPKPGPTWGVSDWIREKASDAGAWIIEKFFN